MTQKHGRRYEHQLTNGIDEITPEEVWTSTVGYSGNSSGGGSDITITVDPKLLTRGETRQFCIEAKKRQGEAGKRTICFDGSKSGDTGVDEIEDLIDSTPPWGQSACVITFDRRRPLIVEPRKLLSDAGVEPYASEMTPYSRYDDTEVFAPRVTDSDSISLVKPETDDWPSATASDEDAIVVAETLDLPTLTK